MAIEAVWVQLDAVAAVVHIQESVILTHHGMFLVWKLRYTKYVRKIGQYIKLFQYKARETKCLIYRVSIKSLPDYKHLLQENYVKYK